ncbi:class I SAM-dependent methyltransferase [Pseudonocardia broussonetiae]|uniref:Class I SAM-dependent methyltransferase n=1 Tax=Pseudonocardia broussonetiae TaxID=2736640 RepID=A0A6M6JI03_9PSEU|nr:class I SAM-dependent methyltransferase [Pseudonocardia broussonetiae]QJY46021.1 class I SAM-dependent methyltransferase [Pseudonocardia broussonetiae]
MTPRPRARLFGTVAAAYAEHRPGYPDAAAWALEPVADRPEPHVLDLGAGTGKLAAALPPGVRVTAVDPDTAMLRELRRHVPHALAVAGTAERVPLAGGSVDAVVVGQAWHWFDPDRALAEIARVLRPGGVLAVVGSDDDGTEWMRGFGEAAARGRPVANGAGAAALALPPHPAFAPPESAAFPNPVRTTTDGLLATMATHSWALLSEPADRDAAFARIRDYVATRPETASGEFVLPLVTTVLRALRR